MGKYFHKPDNVRETLRMTKLLFMAQVKPIRSNWAAVLVMIGLLFLPPLYAWFNIAANWNPYGLTSNLKVAVTNLDEGTELEGVKMNVGDKIVDALKANDSIGWQFVSYEEGQQGVNSGKYYAALVVPKDFSETITGFLNGSTKTAAIEYYINEKENAISTKIMGTGMDTVSNEIDKTFVKTVTTIVLDSLKVADTEYEKYKPQLSKMVDMMDLASQNMALFVDNMDDVENMLDQLDTLSNSTEDVLPATQKALESASDLTKSAQSTLKSSQESVDNIRGLLAQNVSALNAYGNEMAALGNQLQSLGADDVETAQSYISDLLNTVSQLESHITTLADNIQSFNQMLPKPLTGLESFVSRLNNLASLVAQSENRLQDLSDSLADGSADVSSVASDAIALINDLNGQISSTWNAYNNGASASLNSAANQLNETLSSTNGMLESFAALLPAVNSVQSSLDDMDPVSTKTVRQLKALIQSSQKMLEEQVGELKELSEDEQMDKLLDFIQEDAEKQAKFLSSPVKMETNRLYPVANYGSGMSPFYSTLAIWVGCLLMMSMISTINEKGLEKYPNAKLTPMYLSRLFLYQIISFFQSIIIACGDLFLLHVECVHPWIFVLLCICIGQIFAIFVFSLVFTFAGIGKALSIVILVLQIAASGGTFPIEMTPTFFQLIHPLLPFTYCIGAMREICFGVYEPALLKDLAVMVSIPVCSVIMVIIFGPILRRFVNKFEASMKRSGLM
ncbi:MAG: YhgE/Pip domain-containing protein [Peptococcaceae bacterium]|nr:YhgE/Pip domain-containing protein [Peptococcaceae bacterium]